MDSTYYEEISRILVEIWGTVLGWELDELGVGALEDDVEVFSAGVQLMGSWNGAVYVQVPIHTAYEITSGLFEMLPEDCDDDLVRDALGEIANILGGNVKSLIDGVDNLSLPVVTKGNPGQLGTIVGQVIFDSQGERLGAVLLKNSA